MQPFSSTDITGNLSILVNPAGNFPDTSVHLQFDVLFNTDNRGGTGTTVGSFAGTDKILRTTFSGQFPFSSDAGAADSVLIDTTSGNITHLSVPGQVQKNELIVDGNSSSLVADYSDSLVETLPLPMLSVQSQEVPAEVVLKDLDTGVSDVASVTLHIPFFYGIDSSSNLVMIDRLTFNARSIGPTGIGDISSIAVDPTSGTIYGAGNGRTPAIYTLDPATGRASLVGNVGLGSARVLALTFTAKGELLGSVNLANQTGTGGDNLAFINKMTGEASAVRPFGDCTGAAITNSSCTIDGMDSLVLDPLNIQETGLLGATSGKQSSLFSIDGDFVALSNGAPVVRFLWAPILDSAGSPPAGGIVGLAVSCNNGVFGNNQILGIADVGNGTGTGSERELVVIDPRVDHSLAGTNIATARFSIVRSPSIISSGLRAIARPPCSNEADKSNPLHVQPFYSSIYNVASLGPIPSLPDVGPGMGGVIVESDHPDTLLVIANNGRP